MPTTTNTSSSRRIRHRRDEERSEGGRGITSTLRSTSTTSIARPTADRGTEIFENWVRNFHFQFHSQTSADLTAVLAIDCSRSPSSDTWGPCSSSSSCARSVGLYMYLKWEEKKQQAEADRKRDEICTPAAASDFEQSDRPGTSSVCPSASGNRTTPPFPNCRTKSTTAWLAAATKEAVSHSISRSANCSLTMTIAAVCWG